MPTAAYFEVSKPVPFDPSGPVAASARSRGMTSRIGIQRHAGSHRATIDDAAVRRSRNEGVQADAVCRGAAAAARVAKARTRSRARRTDIMTSCDVDSAGRSVARSSPGVRSDVFFLRPGALIHYNLQSPIFGIEFRIWTQRRSPFASKPSALMVAPFRPRRPQRHQPRPGLSRIEDAESAHHRDPRRPRHRLRHDDLPHPCARRAPLSGPHPARGANHLARPPRRLHPYHGLTPAAPRFRSK